jgi:hypothetical protein
MNYRHGFSWPDACNFKRGYPEIDRAICCVRSENSCFDAHRAYTGTFALNAAAQTFTWDGHGNDGRL